MEKTGSLTLRELIKLCGSFTRAMGVAFASSDPNANGVKLLSGAHFRLTDVGEEGEDIFDRTFTYVISGSDDQIAESVRVIQEGVKEAPKT